ncbi:MAG: hypothetical protein WAO00_01310 [Chthoniobacterales bacterium]
MKQKAFVQYLRDTAEVLKPYTRLGSPGTKYWNGTAYVESDTTQFEPQALAWWSTLTAISEMIDHQDTPLSKKQQTYLHGLLFGGMGSLNDLSISSNSSGKNAKSVNAHLDRQRRLLFESFNG